MRQAMGYIDHTPDKETRIELIKTLQSVTEGKVRLPSTPWSAASMHWLDETLNPRPTAHAARRSLWRLSVRG